jgi:hypothetical protein
VPDTGKVLVGGPVVGDQLGLRGDGAEHERMKFLLAKALDHFEPGAPWLAAVHFHRAGDQHLADPAAAGGHDDRVVFGAERDDRLIGLDKPLAAARRGLAANIQAVRYEPRLSWLCSCSAEMPLECVDIRNAAQNQIVSGTCMFVSGHRGLPPQSAHS